MIGVLLCVGMLLAIVCVVVSAKLSSSKKELKRAIEVRRAANDALNDTLRKLDAEIIARNEVQGQLAASRSALSSSDEQNDALRSELAELKTYVDGLKALVLRLQRTSAPAAKKNLPPKIVGRKAKRA